MTKQSIHEDIAEKSVIGSILINKKNLDVVRELGITQDHFLFQANKFIYDAMLQLDEIDATIVYEKMIELGTADSVDPVYLSECIDSTPTDMHVVYYCEIMLQNYRKKYAISVSKKLVSMCESNADIEDVISELEASAAEIKSLLNAKNDGTIKYSQIEDNIVKYCTGNISTGLTTGYRSLDKYFRHKKGILVIATGVPNSGKSEVWDQLMLKTMVIHGWKWTVYSPENYPPEFHFSKLAEKYIGKPMRRRFGIEPMDNLDIRNAIRFYDKHMYSIIPREDGLSINEILNRTKQNKLKYGCDGLLIDPYNEIEHKIPQGMSETQYISMFLSKIRNFSRLYDMEVVLIAHPTKMVPNEDGEYRVPSLYDISGSANFSNKADVGMSVWRSFQQKTYVSDIHITKVRDRNIGERGSVKLKWVQTTGTYEEIEN